MKLNKTKIRIALVITSAVVLVLCVQLYQLKVKKNFNTPINGLKYEKLITEQDRQPLPKQSNGHYFKLPILMYHHVGTVPQNANLTRKDMTVSVEDFQNQVTWLKNNNFTSISLNDLYLFTQGKLRLPKNPVILTFDDGYQDVFENAVPIMEKSGFSGSFGIITQFTGQTMGDNIYASWQTIANAQSRGMEIICHTQNHFDGSNKKFTAEYIFNNLSGCQKDLFDHLGLSEPVLIYPYGHYTPDYILQAKKVGFNLGITVHEGDEINLNNLMEIPRVRMHGNESLETFERIMSHKSHAPSP